MGKNNYETWSEKEAHKPRLYGTQESFKRIIDTESTPCFGVDSVARCFALQLDKIAESENESVKMLGIFGPWGRGKTYFFNRLKKLLMKRETSFTYRIVEFNAWKYQDTPALWAYLYETIYNSASYGEKFRLWFSRVCSWDFVLFWLILLVAWILGSLLLPWDVLSAPFARSVGWSFSILYVFVGFVHLVREKPLTAYRIVKRYVKRKGYKEHLGIQHEIEDDLEKLLHTMCKRDNSQVLLYVDDIDRCSAPRMNNLIDSLRTILENREIQKRLIVICSLDEEKFMRAYLEEQKLKGLSHEKAVKLSREHLDKLFLFGIKLAALDNQQLSDYLRMLVRDSNLENGNVGSNAGLEPPYSESREKHSMVATSGSDEIPILSDETIAKLIDDFMKNQKLEGLTPRKIRIMYYQLLFASSLVAKYGGRFTDDIVTKMLQKSAGLSCHMDIDEALSDVVDMAVPY